MTKRKRNAEYVKFWKGIVHIIPSARLVKVSFYSVECENKVTNGPWDKAWKASGLSWKAVQQ